MHAAHWNAHEALITLKHARDPWKPVINAAHEQGGWYGGRRVAWGGGLGAHGAPEPTGYPSLYDPSMHVPQSAPLSHCWLFRATARKPAGLFFCEQAPIVPSL